MTLSALANMFVLPRGTWTTNKGSGDFFRLEVGDENEKTLSFTQIAGSRDLRKWTWSGSYKVTAAKDSLHFVWTIKDIQTMGRFSRPVLGPLNLKKGDTVSCIWQYGEGTEVVLTFFDEEVQPVFTCQLWQQAKRE